MPSAPIRQLLIVEALGHTRVPFAGYRPDHRAGKRVAEATGHELIVNFRRASKQ